MIYEEIMYGIKCNRCHEIFENSESYTVAVDKDDFEAEATEDGWHKDGDAHYCPKCYMVDENDVIVVKPRIHHLFFKFWNLLKAFTGCVHRFTETETHYTLTNHHCYKRLNKARISILQEVIADFTIEYRTPERMVGQPYEIETISIPKDFKRQ